ncbi:unnamed protein product [Symbiodinium microadriaticum]|nr:unnamed protein product [Symbiodinium microadriaticum]
MEVAPNTASTFEAAPWRHDNDNALHYDHGDFAELEAHLNSQPTWVGDAVRNLLHEEMAHSLSNIHGQVAEYHDTIAKLLEINRSEDAACLRHLLKDIPICSMKALDNNASAVKKEIALLRDFARKPDLKSLEGLARRIATIRAGTFKKKFAELRPKLERLTAEVEKIQRKCEANAEQSQELLQQTERRRDWWFRLFDLIGKTMALGSGAVLAGSVGSLCYYGYLYQSKAAAMGAAKTAYAAAKKLLTEKAATAQAAATDASAAKATAAAKAADVTAANHALQGATDTEVATTCASTNAGPKAVLASLGVGAAIDVFLLHGVYAAHVASEAAYAAASAASSSYAAAQAAMDTASSSVAVATANIEPLQAAMGALSMSMWAVAPLAVASGVVLALCMLGYAGRNALKRMLGKIWADEIREHEGSHATFKHMAGVLKDAVEKLRSASRSNEKLEEAFAVVMEAAEELATQAECGQSLLLDDDFEALDNQVETVASSCEKAAAAFAEMQSRLEAVSKVRFLAYDPSDEQPAPVDAGQDRMCREHSQFEHATRLSQFRRCSMTSDASLCLQEARETEEPEIIPEEAEQLPEEVAPEAEDEFFRDGWILVESSPIPHSTEVNKEILPGCVAVLHIDAARARDLRYTPGQQVRVKQVDIKREQILVDLGSRKGWVNARDVSITQAHGGSSPLPLASAGAAAPNVCIAEDCVPGGTYMLVPIEWAARLSKRSTCFAAGPDGNRMCEVLLQKQANRQVAAFALQEGGRIRVTGDHAFRVCRSGSWIHEQARGLQVGDVVVTSAGEEEVVHRYPASFSDEDVFALNIFQHPSYGRASEIFIFTPNQGKNGQFSFSGVAVLGTSGPVGDFAIQAPRSSSAPPRLRDLPSAGSVHHPREGRCLNVCKQFLRSGQCSRGRECHFCHLPHPEESKRGADEADADTERSMVTGGFEKFKTRKRLQRQLRLKHWTETNPTVGAASVPVVEAAKDMGEDHHLTIHTPHVAVAEPASSVPGFPGYFMVLATVSAETVTYFFGGLSLAIMREGLTGMRRCLRPWRYLSFMPASLAFSWAGFMTYPAIKGFGASQFYLLAQLRVAIIAVFMRIASQIQQPVSVWISLLQLVLGMVVLVWYKA